MTAPERIWVSLDGWEPPATGWRGELRAVASGPHDGYTPFVRAEVGSELLAVAVRAEIARLEGLARADERKRIAGFLQRSARRLEARGPVTGLAFALVAHMLEANSAELDRLDDEDPPT